MLRSILGFTTKSHAHEDAEKELTEVIGLFSKYPLYLAETDKSEFKNECDRLQHELRLYKAGESKAKLRNVDIILNDCRALKCKVKKMIDDRTAAAVRAEISPPMAGAGDGHRIASQEPKIPSPLAPARDALQIKSSNSNQPPNVATRTSLPTTSTRMLATDKARLEPQSGVPSTNPRAGLPKVGHPSRIPVQVNLRQAFSQVQSGISHEVDSMVMVGASAKCPTLNIDSPGSIGASTNFDHLSWKALTNSTTAIISHGPQVAQPQLAPQPARPQRAAGRRAQQQPGNFMNGAYVSHGSMIFRNSSVMGPTLNVNARNSSGAGEYFLSS
ncbi:hypothetical protein DFH29DRAFT_948707 [Suillus ampliporus]|nr:hypothetical protein DFH29DRAFT_948707 [Suillus ampliporus]